MNTKLPECDDRVKKINRKLIPLTAAQDNRTPIDWDAYNPPVPKMPGVHTLKDIAIETIVPYIDWTFFFHAWELKGRYPKILEDPDKGTEASKLFADAQSMLTHITERKWLRLAAVIGLFPANSRGDDIEVYAVNDSEKTAPLVSFHFLRKQGAQPAGRYNASLADYILPTESGKRDYIGGFACTAGLGIDEHIERFESEHDDYSAIMLKALADRLAEALAEWLHEQVRKSYWGYAPDEALDNEALIKETYTGIRPAIGYPACPDHSEKDLLWDLLQVQKRTGIWLTESKAMKPAASVSGLYFCHPDARYFSVGVIGEDQLQAYTARKGMKLSEVKRWLGPNLV